MPPLGVFRIALGTLAGLCIATAGQAGQYNNVARVGSGAVQLADNLDLRPGVYSLGQFALIESLNSASGGEERGQLRHILANPKGPLANTSRRDRRASTVSESEVQLATALRLPRGYYNPAQLALVADIRSDEGDISLTREAFVIENPMKPRASRRMIGRWVRRQPVTSCKWCSPSQGSIV